MYATTILSGLVAALSLTSVSVAEGINCKGSSKCSRGSAWPLADAITYGIDVDRWYNNGEHVACASNGVCAFLQNTGGWQGRKIKEVAHFIPEHG